MKNKLKQIFNIIKSNMIYFDYGKPQNEKLNFVSIQNTAIYFDISALVCRDANTGVHRVVKIILELMIKNYSDQFLIVPMYFRNGYCYYSAKYSLQLNNKQLIQQINTDAYIDKFLSNSIYLRPEINFFMSKSHKISKWLLQQKNQNKVRLINITHDLIPLRFKGISRYTYTRSFKQELLAISRYFDEVICVSKTVSDDYLSWLHENKIKRRKPLNISYFHLGCDIENYNSHYTNNKFTDISKIISLKYFLMVARIEPKKGYKQVLDAFDVLWNNGSNEVLVIVGVGSLGELKLIKRIKSHPELNRKLFWLCDGISDTQLVEIYKNSKAFIMASIAEGFGLGVVEVAKYKKPLILRDTPIFHEVAGDNAYYFSAMTGEELAIELSAWLKLVKNNQEPKSDQLNPITWSESCKQLMSIIIDHEKDTKVQTYSNS
jgi:glycosyltransferase involved in cell wall biosynthesis